MKTTTITSVGDLELAMKKLQACDATLRAAYEGLARKQANERTKYDQMYAADIERKAALEAMIHEYVDRHKSEVFRDGKSLDLPSGTISLRLGPLAVALKKGVQIGAVALQAAGMKLPHIIRTVQELDKQAVKDEIKAGHLGGDDLKQLGIVATQSETITIKLNDA